jgi:hypothetical protein
MEVVSFSEMLAYSQNTTWLSNLEPTIYIHITMNTSNPTSSPKLK